MYLFVLFSVSFMLHLLNSIYYIFSYSILHIFLKFNLNVPNCTVLHWKKNECLEDNYFANLCLFSCVLECPWNKTICVYSLQVTNAYIHMITCLTVSIVFQDGQRQMLCEHVYYNSPVGSSQSIIKKIKIINDTIR